MITNFEQFRSMQKNNESVSVQDAQIKKYCELAFSYCLPKEQTIKIVENIYTDAAKAPEEVNVKFVKENLDKIVETLQQNNTFQYAYQLNFSSEMLENKSPNECAVLVNEKKTDEINILVTSLKTNIAKDNFKVIFENNIFFINDMNILNEHNRNTVFNSLKKNNTINICTQLKWSRKIS